MGGASPPQDTWSSRGLGSCPPPQKEKGSPGSLGGGLRRFCQAEGRRAGSGGTGVGERHQLPPPLGPLQEGGVPLPAQGGGASESQVLFPGGGAALLQSLRHVPHSPLCSLSLPLGVLVMISGVKGSPALGG